MIKKSVAKKVLVFSMSLGMIISLSSYDLALAKIKGYNKSGFMKYDTNANNLLDNNKKGSELCNKLQNDYNKSVTRLSEKREKEMNAIGVFDSEIQALDEKTIDEINNAYSCSVTIRYYEENTTNGTLEEMSSSGIDDIIQELYKDDEEKINPVEKFLSKIIFNSIEVEAKSKSDVTISPSGKMKQIICCTQTRKGGDIKVSYLCKWLQRPKYKKKDIAGIYLKNATPRKNTWKATHQCEYRENANNSYKTESKEIKNYKYSTEGMATSFNLFTGTLVDIKDERILIEFYCTMDDKDWDYIVASGEYYHCKVNTSYSPGISISKDGISLSMSIAWADVYNCIGNNPAVTFYVK